MSSSFTVVLCHGSYHTPEPYQPFLTSLKEHGIEAHCPQLPTSDLSKLNVGDVSNPDFNLEPPAGGYPQPSDDVKVVQTILQKLIVKDSKNVVLFGHSSGGFVASEAAIPELQAKNRKINGLEGGVIGIFYACAFVVPIGESIHSFFQPKDGSPPVPPHFCKFHKYGMDGLGTTNEAARYFFNGLDDEKAKYYESIMTASPILHTVLKNDVYPALPCVYLVTENDLTLPAAYQEGMVTLQNQREGVDIKIVRCQSGHSPQLTWTEGLVAELLGFGTEVLS
ncbi:alpha/beta-hydrolase [Stipitochalara longipes BDJ]|nr:alpha/beta-hydrolase [Stipitochalara longipes BDJ]